MADWVANDTYENVNGLRRHSSSSSGRSLEGRRMTGADDGVDHSSEGSGVSSSSVKLTGGYQLREESVTDTRNGISTNGSVVGGVPGIPPKDPIKMKKPNQSPPIITTTVPVETIHEEEIIIPNDGCLYNFTAEEMASFFRYMRVEDRYIGHLHRKGLDGKRFSRLKDSEMESCGINNPIIKFFRDKSVKRTKGRVMPFLL